MLTIERCDIGRSAGVGAVVVMQVMFISKLGSLYHSPAVLQRIYIPRSRTEQGIASSLTRREMIDLCYAVV